MTLFRSPFLTRGTLITLLLVLMGVTGCASSTAPASSGGSDVPVSVGEGDPQAGRRLMIEKGCGACHTARGVPEATGSIGPALTGIASRPKIADTLPNTPENMKRWMANPPAVKPGTTMPSLGLSSKEAD